MQDQRIKIAYKEDTPHEFIPERSSRNYLDAKSDLKYQQDSKDKMKQYIDENRYYKEDPNHRLRQEVRSNYSELSALQEERAAIKNELAQREIRKFKDDSKDIKIEKEIPRENHIDFFEEKRNGRGGLASTDEIRTREVPYIEENRAFNGETLYKDRIYSEKNRDELAKEEKTTNFRATTQEFNEDRFYRETSKPYVQSVSNARFRNYSTEPDASARPVKPLIASSRIYQEDNIYSSQNLSRGSKDNLARPGILKNSSTDSARSTRFSSVQVNQSINSIISPKESASNTYRESTLPDKYEEEITEKPNSILKNSWISEKDYNPRSSRFESVEKKVNFSDSVFHIEDSNKDQMPEIKIVSMRIPEKKTGNSPEYRSKSYIENIDQKPLLEYKSSGLKTNNYLSADYRHSTSSDSKIIEKANAWPCPKCSSLIPSNSYECNSCRYINWDKFYVLKSKSPKPRSESIPVKLNERDDNTRSYKSLRLTLL